MLLTDGSTRLSKQTVSTHLGLLSLLCFLLFQHFPTTRWWSVHSSVPFYTRVSKMCSHWSVHRTTKSIIELWPRLSLAKCTDVHPYAWIWCSLWAIPNLHISPIMKHLSSSGLEVSFYWWPHSGVTIVSHMDIKVQKLNYGIIERGTIHHAPWVVHQFSFFSPSGSDPIRDSPTKNLSTGCLPTNPNLRPCSKVRPYQTNGITKFNIVKKESNIFFKLF